MKKVYTKETAKMEKKKLLNQREKLNQKIKEIPHFCNQCGNSCLISNDHFNENYGMIDIIVHGGYNSIALDDDTSYNFSLCEKCVKVLFDGFKVKPDIREK